MSRRIVYDVAASLDGFISGPGGALGSFLMEGPHVDDYLERLSRYDTVLMGRRTYELGYAFGLKPGERPYAHMDTYVVSSTLELPPDSQVETIRDTVLDSVRQLRSRCGGDIYLSGGGELAGGLLSAGLIDRLIVKLNPILLGGGTPLFAGPGAAMLRLAECRRYDNGVALLTYELSRPISVNLPG